MDDEEEGLPAWFTGPLLVTMVGLASFCVVGLSTATLGVFRPAPTIALTFALAALVLWWLRADVRHRPASTTTSTQVVAALVVIGALATAAWNAAHHSEHLIIDRDPGIYLATGAWLADEGTLRVDGLAGPFVDEPTLRLAGAGFAPRPDGTLQPQFPHLTATFLGAVGWVDKKAMFLLNPMLGGLALLSWFALGSRLGRPLGAATGVGLLALSFPFAYFSRDTYSEPLAMLLVAGGLWVLSLAFDRASPRLGLLAGFLLGATCMARIDGYLSLVPLAAILAVELRLARIPALRRTALAAMGAMAVAATAGGLETWAFSRSYFDHDLRPRLPLMVGAAVAAGAAGFVAARWIWTQQDEPTEEGTNDPPSNSSTVTPVATVTSLVAVAGLASFLLWARFLRPAAGDLPDLWSAATAERAQLLRQARTISYEWLEWYFGVALVGLGFVGLALLLWRGVRAPGGRRALPFAGVILTTTLLYLYSPSITPDHPWAIRRFVAVALPGLALAAGWLLGELWARRGRWRGATRAGAVALTCLCLVGVVEGTRPFRSLRVGVPAEQRFDEICAIADDAPTAILVAPHALLGFTIPDSLRSWCGVPVAGATDATTNEDVVRLAEEWQAAGRQLLLVATSPTGLGGDPLEGTVTALPESVLVAPEVTLARPPRAVVGDQRLTANGGGVLRLYVIEVGTPGSSAE